jgi:glycosyltransferase involved in cell wall biosynthesis
LRDPAYNIAYWNLHERAAELRFENDQLTIGLRPVVFFHYSGFDPSTPNVISLHQNRFSMKDYPNVRPVYQFYRKQLEAEGHVQINQWTYAFGSFDNGVKIPDAARTLYAQTNQRQKIKFGNPFSAASANSLFSWINQPIDHLVLPNTPVLTRLHMEFYNSRPDLHAAYPEPLGNNRLQLIRWLEAHAVEDFKIDPYFVPGKHYTKSSKVQGRLGMAQFQLKKLISNSHSRLKEAVKRAFPPESPWFRILQVFNFRYLEPNVGKVQPAMPQQVPARSSLPFGVNVAGYIKGEFGVAEVARASLKSLAAVDVPHVLNNIEAQAYRDNDPTFAEFSPNNPYRVNLIHVNADQIPVFANAKGPAYFQGRYNIACWFWELSTFPKQWRPAFDYLQEIWVASGFCQESIARSAPIPVVKMNFPILIDEDQVRPNREPYSLPEDVFIFGFVFDFHSLVERKNPLGLLKAFEMAFEDRKDVLLVLKSINGRHAPEKMQHLQEAAQRSRVNLKLIDEYLPRQEAINLVATFDSFVSLHRSEGLGIGLAQAMYLKKPVIATSYSGNMEFMNHNNSFLVRYQLAELQESYGPYEMGNTWAEPDLEHAARLMRQVHADRGLAAQIAERASIDIRTRMVPEVTGQSMKARLQLIS